MPLLVPDDSAYMNYILPDILKIVDGDTSVGDEKAAGPGLKVITYGHTKQGFAQSHFFNIVHGTSNYNILLKYVQSSFPLPEDPPVNIAKRQGATYAPGSGTANPDNSGVILVYLDAYNDNGANYWVRGQDGSKIFSPRWVQLFHELSHALHIARGQVTKDTPDAQEDVLTIGDENKLRAQYNGKYPWLKQRSPNEEGDSGATDPDPNVNNPTPKTNCFIVSAAYGSPQALQVRKFQQLRDDLLRRSALGDEFVTQAATQYYQFSPQVATDMSNSQPLRLSISKLLVEPLMDFFTLLEQYVSGDWQKKQFEDQVERTLMRFLVGLPEAGFSSDHVDVIRAEIQRLDGRLEHQSELAKARREVPSIPRVCTDVILILDYLAGVIDAKTVTTGYIRWALMAPLVIYWSALSQLNHYQSGKSNIRVYITQAINNWLSVFPIPPAFEHFGESAAQDSLVQLSQTVFTIPSVRQKLGSHLLETYGGQVSYNLQATLQRAGYLPVSCIW